MRKWIIIAVVCLALAGVGALISGAADLVTNRATLVYLAAAGEEVAVESEPCTLVVLARKPTLTASPPIALPGWRITLTQEIEGAGGPMRLKEPTFGGSYVAGSSSLDGQVIADPVPTGEVLVYELSEVAQGHTAQLRYTVEMARH
jgi:hypothetical protein